MSGMRIVIEIMFSGVYLFSIMYPEIPQPISHQPQLFLLEESLGTVELFPTVWKALEDLTVEDEFIRGAAIEQLAEIGAPRISPVVTYILVTRIVEPRLDLRVRIIEILSDVMTLDINGLPSPENVRNSLRLYLSSIRTRQIFALLQVSAEYPSMEYHVSRLLSSSSFGGNHLIDILNDRKNPIEIRKQAAVMIGKVGYLYTLPALEKIAARLEAYLSGQITMQFASQASSSESDLLPLVEEALSSLKSQ